MLLPQFEQEILSTTDYQRIVGIDEVGRGCWAGPVAVGAYFYTPNLPTYENVNDSKLLSLAKRRALYNALRSSQYEVVYRTSSEIDNLGIARAIEHIILSLIEKYSDGKTLFLVDGRFKASFGPHAKQFIKGDRTYYSIAAASVLAKVERDTLMQKLDKDYPGYGFAQHKGYGTRKHQECLQALGPSQIHRRSYRPVGSIVNHKF